MKKKLKRKQDKSFKRFAKLNCLSTENMISLDDRKNQKYLDELMYQEYLKNMNNENSDFNE